MNAVAPLRLTLKNTPLTPDSWTIVTPTAQHVVSGLGNAEAWARRHLESHPAGGWIMIVDTFGLAVSDTFVAPAPVSTGAAMGAANATSAAPAAAVATRATHHAPSTLPAQHAFAGLPEQRPAGLEMRDLIEVPDLSLGVYWTTAESFDAPFTPLDGDVRLRRQSSFVVIEAPIHWEGEGDGWARWWVDPTDQAAIVSLESVMGLARDLGSRAAGSPASRLLEQTAPELVGLVRYGAGHVDGTSVAALHLEAEGETPVSLLVVPLPQPLPAVIDTAWVERTIIAPSLATSVAQSCARLDQAVRSVDLETLEALRRSPAVDWRQKLAGAGGIARDVKALIDLAEKVWNLFQE